MSKGSYKTPVPPKTSASSHQKPPEIVDRAYPPVNNGNFIGSMEIHSGPLPNPETLRKYDEVLPGTAERIIAMAEKEQNHVHSTVKRVQIWTLARKQIGQISGLLIAIGGLSGGTWLVYKGHDWAGTAIAGVGLSSLVGLFVKEYSEKNSTPRK